MCTTGKDAYCFNAKYYGFHDFEINGSVCSHAVRKEQWLFKFSDAISSLDAAPLMCKSTSIANGQRTNLYKAAAVPSGCH